MAKPAPLIPKKYLQVYLPSDLILRIYADLYSHVERRIPHGAISHFIERLIREHYSRQEATRP